MCFFLQHVSLQVIECALVVAKAPKTIGWTDPEGDVITYDQSEAAYGDVVSHRLFQYLPSLAMM